MADDAWPPFSHVPPLPCDEVHVWQSALDHDPATVQRLEGLLDFDERGRAGRFYFRKDRERYIVGRGLLRMLLGQYLRVGPDAVRLWYTAHGKPVLVSEIGESDLTFNVAHSDSLILYAVARGREVGVDLERLRPGVECRELAEWFFSPREAAELAAVPPEQQERAFFAGWTRKEAYIKALGLGMAVPLDRFAVSLAPDRAAALLAAEHDPAQLGRWELCELTPAPGYLGALAVEGTGWRFFCGRWEPVG
jgi:4'-phosphopantetheinyl transferase